MERARKKQEMEQLIRRNIEYDVLFLRNPSCDKEIDEIVSLMTEVATSRRSTIHLDKQGIPQPMVKERLLSLQCEHIEYVLEIVVTAQEEEEHSVVSDAYPLDGEPFRAEQTEIGSITSDDTVGQTQIIGAEIELPPEIPAMQELIGAFSAPVALETVGDDAAHAEGLMRVTLLYRPQDDPAALASYTQEIPFALDFDRISGLSQISGAQIGRVESEKLAPDRAQVRIPLMLTAEKVETASVPVLADVAFEGEPASLPKGVVLYYPREGESEWEIAKRFRFSQEALQKRNPEGKAPYLIFRRLTGE